MRARSQALVIAVLGVLLVLVSACSSNRVLMPAPIDLHAFGTIGLLEFTSTAGANINILASREFLAAIHSAQPGVPVLEIGDRQRGLTAVGHAAIDADAIRALGKRHQVDTLLVGELDARRVTPGVRLGTGFESLSAGADLQGALTVRMYDTRTGATLWTEAVTGSTPIAAVAVANGNLSGLGVTDPQAAESRLVQALVSRATQDFWPYWVRQ
jgi:hypothetical protein